LTAEPTLARYSAYASSSPLSRGWLGWSCPSTFDSPSIARALSPVIRPSARTAAIFATMTFLVDGRVATAVSSPIAPANRACPIASAALVARSTLRGSVSSSFASASRCAAIASADGAGSPGFGAGAGSPVFDGVVDFAPPPPPHAASTRTIASRIIRAR